MRPKIERNIFFLESIIHGMPAMQLAKNYNRSVSCVNNCAIGTAQKLQKAAIHFGIEGAENLECRTFRELRKNKDKWQEIIDDWRKRPGAIDDPFFKLPEVKPCPFCGRSAKYLKDVPGEWELTHKRNCYLKSRVCERIIWGTQGFTAWNRRP